MPILTADIRAGADRPEKRHATCCAGSSEKHARLRHRRAEKNYPTIPMGGGMEKGTSPRAAGRRPTAARTDKGAQVAVYEGGRPDGEKGRPASGVKDVRGGCLYFTEGSERRSATATRESMLPRLPRAHWTSCVTGVFALEGVPPSSARAVTAGEPKPKR